MVLGQNLRESPDFVKGIIERCRGGADHVWFAEIAFYTRGLEFIEQFLRVLVR